ncbi:LADA_0H08108g1_1 [Lachancea dasiensis]|uniref:LADA_0H08108g1_1 n=1 Tax=Lachancea dasiensis TaxID=1072105 RepID=A0A1G4K2B4_9SACH|nr:LADA_0H08108g1_1 [Lachancea dasiensis]
MIRRQPTAISLTSEDIVELEEELEEFRLQREIKAQQRNLQRSATRLAAEDLKQTMPLHDYVAQKSPLQKLSRPDVGVPRPPSESLNVANEGTTGTTGTNHNPFYTEH